MVGSSSLAIMSSSSGRDDWADAGRLVMQSSVAPLVERLQNGGVIRLEGDRLYLKTGISCPTDLCNQFADFLVQATVEEQVTDWIGKREEKSRPSCRRLLYDPMADRSLSDIYRHIPSPPATEAEQPEEVTTRMFPYQLRTLHRMLQREETPEDITPEYWIPLATANGPPLQIHPVTLRMRHVLPARKALKDARGGILSEEMGVGKTLECIALILSTRGSLPCADDDNMASPITTSLALSWPHKEGHGLDPLPKDALQLSQMPYYSREITERSRPLAVSYVNLSPSPSDERCPRGKLPSLQHLCAHVIRMSGQSIAPEQYEEVDTQVNVRAMAALLKRATPFYHLWPPLRGHRTPRVDIERAPIRVYLSAATLVVVPGTLLAQWRAEICKHTRERSLRVLYLPEAQSQIPSALELANDYDIILLSHARLGKEDSEGSLEWKWPHVPRQCRCPYIGATRTIECRCPPLQPYRPSQDMSPLLQCKFKRLCLDEGHVAAGDSDMVRMATKIKSECRWIISGTPTESLVGSDLYRSSSNMHNGVSKTEMKDLTKLRALLADFLQVPFMQDWHHDYELPYKRTMLYSSTRMWKLLSRVMVRNQPQDVQDDSPLPPLRDETVRLTFTRLERETFNVLQSLILLNAVWSQREDDDYFFHHSNRKHLASIVENLSLSCFHFAGPNLKEQANDALKHAYKQLDKQDKWNETDRGQAGTAIRHLESALSNEEWTAQSTDVIFQTRHLEEDIARAWSRYGLDAKSQLSAEEIMSMQRAMRTILRRQRIGKLEEGDLARVEELITEGERDRRAFHERRAKAEASRLEKTKTEDDANVSSNISVPMKPSSPIKSPSKVTKKIGGGGKLSILEQVQHDYEEREELPFNSQMHQACLPSTSSTKLGRLLQLVAAIPQDEKAIIFSNLDNALYEVSTALDVASLPHFIYASGSNQDRRNEVISAFRSEQKLVRILLMKTNIGGRGLDLSCANHAIFLEPILDKSLRIQALKRTWRTGQTRPVHATTLIVEDTFEEDILRVSETASTYKLSEEPSMRAVVSNPTFVSESSSHDEASRGLYPSIKLFTRAFVDAEDVENKRGEGSSTAQWEPHPLPTPPLSPDKVMMIKDRTNLPAELPQSSAVFSARALKTEHERCGDEAGPAKKKQRKVAFV